MKNALAAIEKGQYSEVRHSCHLDCHCLDQKPCCIGAMSNQHWHSHTAATALYNAMDMCAATKMNVLTHCMHITCMGAAPAPNQYDKIKIMHGLAGSAGS